MKKHFIKLLGIAVLLYVSSTTKVSAANCVMITDPQDCQIGGCLWSAGACINPPTGNTQGLNLQLQPFNPGQGIFSSNFETLNLPLLGNSTYTSTQDFFSKLLSNILPITLILAGLALFLLILAGGFQIMTAVQNPDQAEAGKQKITAALIGFMIIFSSYWIVEFLQVITGITIFG